MGSPEDFRPHSIRSARRQYYILPPRVNMYKEINPNRIKKSIQTGSSQLIECAKSASTVDKQRRLEIYMAAEIKNGIIAFHVI